MNFAFSAKSNTVTPSIHELRMKQMFSSSNYTKQKDYNFNLKDIFAINIEIPVKEVEEKKQEGNFFKQIFSFVEGLELNDLNLFVMSPETASEYYLYKKRKAEKIKYRNADFSFFEIDGSINYSSVFSGMLSDNVYIRDRAIALFEDSIGDFVRSQYCMDYISMVLSSILALYLFLSLFYNNPDCLRYYLFLF